MAVNRLSSRQYTQTHGWPRVTIVSLPGPGGLAIPANLDRVYLIGATDGADFRLIPQEGGVDTTTGGIRPDGTGSIWLPYGQYPGLITMRFILLPLVFPTVVTLIEGFELTANGVAEPPDWLPHIVAAQMETEHALSAGRGPVWPDRQPCRLAERAPTRRR